ncbi:MAG: CDP-alcohol phosphatidyltransferase family protein [Candidatus Thorarchaeota archaeon]
MPEKGDGLVSKYLNRPISHQISKFILHFWPLCNPNIISIISAITGIFGSILFYINFPLLGGIFVQLSSIIDGSDGEVARANGRTSFFGGFFDSVMDRYVDVLIFVSLIFYSLRVLFIIHAFLLGIITITGSYLISYTAAKVELKDGISFSRTIQGRDTRLFIVFLAGICAIFSDWAIPICLVLISILTHGFVILRINQLRKNKELD